MKTNGEEQFGKMEGKNGRMRKQKRNNKKYETFCFIFCMMKNW
jgi:hypothetical protein